MLNESQNDFFCEVASINETRSSGNKNERISEEEIEWTHAGRI